MGFLGSILQCSESWLVILGSLPTKENLNLEAPSSTGSVLAWGMGNVTKVQQLL